MRFTTFLVRRFSVDFWWTIYKKSQQSSGILKEVYTYFSMRMVAKNGGALGHGAVIKGKPILPHEFNSVFIHCDAVIGANCLICQGVNIAAGKNGAPKIGDNVSIGANSVVFGGITVGDNVKIGAGTVVCTDIPSIGIGV